jgi:hypothetical protein
MTETALTQFKELFTLFNNDANRVAKILAQENRSYQFIDMWYYDPDCDTIEGQGDETWNYGGYERHYVSFPSKYLTYTDEQLQKIVDKNIKASKAREAAEKRKEKKERLEAEKAQYEKLKAKFENKK